VKGTLRDKAIALAGVFQAAYLVEQTARRGIADIRDLQVSLESVFVQSPAVTDEVFGAARHLRTGLKTLCRQLGQNSRERDLDVTRYTVSLLHLARRLAGQPTMLARIRQDLEQMRAQGPELSVSDEAVQARLADLYSQTVSQLPPRIMVSGEPHLLANPNNANRIRALLLAGIRAAVLWLQVGGSRWQILFQRRAFVTAAERLLREEANPPSS
jgi:high frequency lysogenization protein